MALQIMWETNAAKIDGQETTFIADSRSHRDLCRRRGPCRIERSVRVPWMQCAQGSALSRTNEAFLMARGGSRIGAGRPRKGETADQKRARLAQPVETKVAASGLTPSGAILPVGDDLDADLSPLDFLKAIQRDKRQPIEVRLRAAVAAAPYAHAKLRDAGMGLKDERKKRANDVGKSTSRFAASAAPLALVGGGKAGT
jgi:hypothetical protein